MPGKSTRFLIDTNLFIAAVKRGNTKSTELFLRLLDGSWELVADDILVSEYEKYAKKFEADAFLAILLGKLVIIEQSEEDNLVRLHARLGPLAPTGRRPAQGSLTVRQPQSRGREQWPCCKVAGTLSKPLLPERKACHQQLCHFRQLRTIHRG